MHRTRRPTRTPAVRPDELSAIVEHLGQAIEPDYISVWLHKPLAALDDQKPIDVIARGEYRRVNRLIAALESPVAS